MGRESLAYWSTCLSSTTSSSRCYVQYSRFSLSLSGGLNEMAEYWAKFSHWGVAPCFFPTVSVEGSKLCVRASGGVCTALPTENISFTQLSGLKHRLSRKAVMANTMIWNKPPVRKMVWTKADGLEELLFPFVLRPEQGCWSFPVDLKAKYLNTLGALKWHKSENQPNYFHFPWRDEPLWDKNIDTESVCNCIHKMHIWKTLFSGDVS